MAAAAEKRQKTQRISKEQKLELIALWKDKPELWDVTNEDYHNKVKKDAALNSISKTIGWTAEAVKNTLHSLRTQYSGAKRIEKTQDPTGSAARTRRTWWLTTELSFLSRSVTGRFSESNVRNIFIFINS